MSNKRDDTTGTSHSNLIFKGDDAGGYQYETTTISIDYLPDLSWNGVDFSLCLLRSRFFLLTSSYFVEAFWIFQLRFLCNRFWYHSIDLIFFFCFLILFSLFSSHSSCLSSSSSALNWMDSFHSFHLYIYIFFFWKAVVMLYLNHLIGFNYLYAVANLIFIARFVFHVERIFSFCLFQICNQLVFFMWSFDRFAFFQTWEKNIAFKSLCSFFVSLSFF